MDKRKIFIDKIFNDFPESQILINIGDSKGCVGIKEDNKLFFICEDNESCKLYDLNEYEEIFKDKKYRCFLFNKLIFKLKENIYFSGCFILGDFYDGSDLTFHYNEKEESLKFKTPNYELKIDNECRFEISSQENISHFAYSFDLFKSLIYKKMILDSMNIDRKILLFILEIFDRLYIFNNSFEFDIDINENIINIYGSNNNNNNNNNNSNNNNNFICLSLKNEFILLGDNIKYKNIDDAKELFNTEYFKNF